MICAAPQGWSTRKFATTSGYMLATLASKSEPRLRSKRAAATVA